MTTAVSVTLLSTVALVTSRSQGSSATSIVVATANPCPADAGAGGRGTTSTSDGLSQAAHGCVVIVHGTTTEVFTYTGSVQTWTVPNGVTSARVHLVGAGGGGAVRVGAGNGGGGGYATGELTVLAGAQYQVIVGGGGRHQCVADHTTPDVAARRNSSFGGGAAGYGAIGFNCTWASGGGRSALRLTGEDDDIVTAGGGGGGGFSSNGGAGGGLIGASGGPAFNGRAASGGTQVAGGLGGDGNEPAYDGVQHLGGPAGFNLGSPSEGGGGGGGWWGGGGGGNNAGGGGGSSRISHPGLSSGCTIAGNGRTSGAVSTSALTPPTVSGTPVIGAQLTAHSGTWTCHLTRQFQWQTSPDGSTWTDVGGATSTTFTITTTGFTRVRETAINLFGSGSTQSAATAISVDTSLANLTVSAGTMVPTFSPTVFDYRVSVPHTTASLTITPTRAHASTTITVNGSSVTSGTASGDVTLAVGTTSISVLSTNSGVTTTTSVVVERPAAPTSGPPTAVSLPAEPLPAALGPLVTTPVPTTQPTTTANPSTTTTTIPTTTPTTAQPSTPVPTPRGPLPDLEPGTALLIAAGRAVALEAFVEGGTDFVTQLSDQSFGLRLSSQCGPAACPLVSTSDGRAHVRATPDGTVTVEGYGFRPGSLVTVWLFSSPRFLGSLGVASDGTFLGVLPLGGAPEGEHTLQANGVREDGVEQSVNLGLTVASTERLGPRLPATGGSAELWLGALAVLAVGLAMLSARLPRGSDGACRSRP